MLPSQSARSGVDVAFVVICKRKSKRRGFCLKKRRERRDKKFKRKFAINLVLLLGFTGIRPKRVSTRSSSRVFICSHVFQSRSFLFEFLLGWGCDPRLAKEGLGCGRFRLAAAALDPNEHSSAGTPLRRLGLGVRVSKIGKNSIISKFCKFCNFFGGLVFGCIKTNFCKILKTF